MGIGIVLVDEVHIVGANHLDAEFLRHLQQHLVHLLLALKGLMVSPRHGGLVALQFKVVVVAIDALEPTCHLFGLLHLAVHDEARNLATQTCRAADDALAVGLKFVLVGARMLITPFGPRLRHYLDEVFVTLQVLGQQDEMTACVALIDMGVQVLLGHIHLAAEYGDELLAIGQAFVLFVHIIMQLLDAEHVAMVGERHAAHTVGNGLVHEGLHWCLAIEDRIL